MEKQDLSQLPESPMGSTLHSQMSNNQAGIQGSGSRSQMLPAEAGVDEPHQLMPHMIQPPTGVQPVIVHVTPPTQNCFKVFSSYNKRHSAVIGIIIIILSVLCCILGVVGYAINKKDVTYHYVDDRGADTAYMDKSDIHDALTSIWASAFIFPSGVLALLAAKKKNFCTIVVLHTLSVVAIIFTVPLIGTSLASVIEDTDDRRFYYYHAIQTQQKDTRNSYNDPQYEFVRRYVPKFAAVGKGLLALSALLLIFSLALFAMCIWAIIATCRILCCERSNGNTCCCCCERNQEVVIPTVGYTANSQQPVVILGYPTNSGQVLMGETQLQNQPGVPQFILPEDARPAQASGFTSPPQYTEALPNNSPPSY